MLIIFVNYFYYTLKNAGLSISLSLGWNIGEENFMQNVDFINLFKLRGSWGQLGNDNIKGYQYLTFYEVNPVGVGRGNPTTLQNNIILSRMRTLDVTWETSIYNYITHLKFINFCSYPLPILPMSQV